MKYLSHYIEEEQTRLFNDLGVFFAFSNKQFEEGLDKIKESGLLKGGEKVARLPHGAFCPSKNADKFLEEHDKLVERGIEKDLEENGKKNIIWREFANHECQILMDYSDAIAALADYPITKEAIESEWGAYFQNCIDNDYF